MIYTHIYVIIYVIIFISISLSLSLSMYIYIYIFVVWLEKPITVPILLVCARTTEGYSFIEFEISNIIISTGFHQPLIDHV